MSHHSSLISSLVFLLLIGWGCSNTKESRSESEEDTNSEKTEKSQEEKLKNTDLSKKVKNKVPPKDSLKKKQGSSEKQLFARHRRTACFGKCPQYQLSIQKDGMATLKAERDTEMDTGTYSGKIPEKEIQRIKETAEAIGFFEMEKKYDDPGVTDLPSRISYLAFDGKEHEVMNRYQGPERLKKLEDIFEEIVEDTEWKEEASTD